MQTLLRDISFNVEKVGSKQALDGPFEELDELVEHDAGLQRHTAPGWNQSVDGRSRNVGLR